MKSASEKNEVGCFMYVPGVFVKSCVFFQAVSAVTLSRTSAAGSRTGRTTSIGTATEGLHLPLEQVPPGITLARVSYTRFLLLLQASWVRPFYSGAAVLQKAKCGVHLVYVII